MIDRLDRNDERGFTVIEIVLAILILTILAAGFAHFVIGAGKTQSSARLRVAETAMAEAVWERVQASGKWARTAPCSTAPAYACDVPTTVYSSVISADQRASYTVRATATGVDAGADGKGPADRDGTVPDFFNVTVSVKQVGTARVPFTVSGVLDPAKAGTNGAISMQVCQVYPQVDERMELTACPPGGIDRTLAQPTLGTSFVTDERYALEAANALVAATGDPRYTQVRVIPLANARVDINGASGTSPTMTDDAGRVRFTDLKPGLYTVEVEHPLGDNFVPWGSHSVPSAGTIVVSSGEEAQSLQVMRPKGVEVSLDLASEGEDEIDTAEAGGYWIRLFPVPFDRVNIGVAAGMTEADLTNHGWVKVNAGDDRATIASVEPGLYAALTLLHKPGVGTFVEDLIVDEGEGNIAAYESDELDVEYGLVWIDPTGALSSNLPVYWPKFVECVGCEGEPFDLGTGGA